MSTAVKILLGVLGIGFIFVIILGCVFISNMNQEARLRNAITAKQKDNTSEFDNMYKKIKQNAEVSKEQMESLKTIFVEHAKARSGDQPNGTLASWIKESVPNVDAETFKNLQNILTASRDAWTMRQKELLDLKREHDNMIDVFPSSIVCKFLGREKIDVVVITSTKTDDAFKSGKDDETSVFQKPETK